MRQKEVQEEIEMDNGERVLVFQALKLAPAPVNPQLLPPSTSSTVGSMFWNGGAENSLLEDDMLDLDHLDSIDEGEEIVNEDGEDDLVTEVEVQRELLQRRALQAVAAANAAYNAEMNATQPDRDTRPPSVTNSPRVSKIPVKVKGEVSDSTKDDRGLARGGVTSSSTENLFDSLDFSQRGLDKSFKSVQRATSEGRLTPPPSPRFEDAIDLGDEQPQKQIQHPAQQSSKERVFSPPSVQDLRRLTPTSDMRSGLTGTEQQKIDTSSTVNNALPKANPKETADGSILIRRPSLVEKLALSPKKAVPMSGVTPRSAGSAAHSPRRNPKTSGQSNLQGDEGKSQGEIKKFPLSRAQAIQARSHVDNRAQGEKMQPRPPAAPVVAASDMRRGRPRNDQSERDSRYASGVEVPPREQWAEERVSSRGSARETPRELRDRREYDEHHQQQRLDDIHREYRDGRDRIRDRFDPKEKHSERSPRDIERDFYGVPLSDRHHSERARGERGRPMDATTRQQMEEEKLLRFVIFSSSLPQRSQFLLLLIVFTFVPQRNRHAQPKATKQAAEHQRSHRACFGSGAWFGQRSK